MMPKKVIQQIQELLPNKGYAIVFNQRLRAEDLNQLKEICQAASIKVLILTDARVVPLDKLAGVIGRADEAELAKVLDVTEAQPEPRHDWNGA
jgi:hypothetical protein